MPLRVAFWNVKDLFEPDSGVDRGPKTQAELDAKIAIIARVLSGLFDNQGPDLIGLAEIHTERILNQLVRQLATTYHMLWEMPKHPTYAHTGIAEEGSVRYAVDHIGYRADGYMRPRRWAYNNGVPSGASDHFPLIATFRV